MCSQLPKKTKIIETNIQNYLTCSYHHGYNLNLYFSEKQQIIMFERLLSCDANFKDDWENGVYSIPEDPSQTMHLSRYIKMQSATKKFSRKISKYIYQKNLTKGAKNLLQAHMIKQSQDYMQDENRNIDSKMKEMFCGIFKNIDDRKKNILETKLPSDAVNEIFTFIPRGGTKRSRFIKTKLQTRKKRAT
jgi:hypothetical protein